MFSTRNQTGDIEPINAIILDENNLPITGLTDIFVSIRRISDNYFFDFSDTTFKNAGWTTRLQVMTEIDSTNSPGEYSYLWDTSLITNETANDTYSIRVDQDPLDAAKNVPQIGEIKAGQYVDYIDASIDGIPVATDIVLTAAHGSGTWQGIGTVEAVADAIWDEAFADHETVDSMGFIMKLIRAFVTAEMEQDPALNEWIIKDPDTGLPWLRFDTENANGDPASVSIYKRIPK